MADSNFTFNRPYKPFGMNVKVPERTLQQAGETLGEIVKAPATPLMVTLLLKSTKPSLKTSQ